MKAEEKTEDFGMCSGFCLLFSLLPSSLILSLRHQMCSLLSCCDEPVWWRAWVREDRTGLASPEDRHRLV